MLSSGCTGTKTGGHHQHGQPCPRPPSTAASQRPQRGAPLTPQDPPPTAPQRSPQPSWGRSARRQPARGRIPAGLTASGPRAWLLTLLAPNCTRAFPFTSVALICMITDSME